MASTVEMADKVDEKKAQLAITHCTHHLVKIHFSDIQPHLIAQCLLDEQQCSYVRDIHGDNGKMIHVLNIVKSSGLNKTYSLFLDILNDTNYQHMSDKIEQEYMGK